MTVNIRKKHLRKLDTRLRSQDPKYRAARPAATSAKIKVRFMMSICHHDDSSDRGIKQ